MPEDADGEPETALETADLYERLAAGEDVTVLDVRDRDEFEAWHVDGPGVDARQIPHVRFIQAEATGATGDLAAEHGLDGPVVVVCGRGEASDHAAGLLRDAGVAAANLAGGMEAWARLYVSKDVRSGDPDGPLVRQYVRPSSGCLAYLVADGGEAVVVDPLRAFADRYVEDAEALGAEVTAVVDTHVHADHLSGLRAVADRVGVPASLPVGASGRGLDFEATLIDDGEEIAVGDASLSAVHVPGHTSEMTAFRVGDGLLSGDSLFVESVARPDLEAGHEGAADLAEQLYESLHDRILAMPDDTVVAPGHVGPRTAPAEDGTYTAELGSLRDDLDLLGLSREAFVERVLEDMPPRPANYERIVAANLGRESIDEEEGFEVELGPNNCAVST